MIAKIDLPAAEKRTFKRRHKLIYANLYRVSFDLASDNAGALGDNVEERYVVAPDLARALAYANSIRGQLRRTAIHKELVVADIAIVQRDVLVAAGAVNWVGKEES